MSPDNNQNQRSGGGMDENKQREDASKRSKATHQGGTTESSTEAGSKGPGSNQNQEGGDSY